LSDEYTGSITCPRPIQDEAEKEIVQPDCLPEAIPTQLDGVKYITNSSSCPDLSLFHDDHQFQHHQHLRDHQPLLQQHMLTLFDPASLSQMRSRSYPM
jgi:hypothetical protein